MPIDPEKKLAGLLLPVFAMRHAQDQGIGDTTAMRESIDFCARYGIGVLQVLPVNETGGDNSPYNAISSVALDPTSIDARPGMVPGLTAEAFAATAPESLLSELRSGAVDYRRVKPLKEKLLWHAFAEFDRRDVTAASPDAARLAAFEEEESSWLAAYTLFRTVMKEHDGNACWTSWEHRLRTVEEAEQWLALSPERERLIYYRRFCAFVQWVAFSQWRGVKEYAECKGVRLMGDIPFGVSRYSADVWAQPELFDLDWSGGAPPEILFQGDVFLKRWGQNWGIPLYDWQAHRRQVFAWWRQRVEKVGEFFHYFRIDHVLGFFRIYAFPWIPERNWEFVNLTEEEAAERTGGRLPQFLPRPDEPEDYARANAREGKALLQMILDAAGEVGVVAEDLGVVPDYVRPVLKELGIPGFYIPIFERDEDDRSLKPVEEMPPLSLGTFATHDHLPVVELYDRMVERWLGPDGHEGWLEMQRLMRFLGLDEHAAPRTFTPELHRALLDSLLNSPCWLAILMVTDLLCTRQRFNEPGSASESNWSQRLDRPLPAFSDDPVFAPRLAAFAELIEQSGRVPAGLTQGPAAHAADDTAGLRRRPLPW